jgi:hypothetical protein
VPFVNPVTVTDVAVETSSLNVVHVVLLVEYWTNQSVTDEAPEGFMVQLKPIWVLPMFAIVVPTLPGVTPGITEIAVEYAPVPIAFTAATLKKYVA